MKWGCLEMFNVGKSTKYKIYFSVWAFIMSIALISNPVLRWNKNNEMKVDILNPIVESPFMNTRNSLESLAFTNKVDGIRHSIKCSLLKIDEKETFCDWYDGKNPEHKVSSIQKVSIVYLQTSYEKNKKTKKHSFVNEIEFLDKEKNVHHFVIGKNKVNKQIRSKIISAWGIVLMAFILSFPPVLKWIFSGGDKERMKYDRNYEQLMNLKFALVSFIIIGLLHYLIWKISKL